MINSEGSEKLLNRVSVTKKPWRLPGCLKLWDRIADYNFTHLV